MVRRLLLFSTICSILLLGYFLPRWVGPHNCINSSLVEEITIAPENHKIYLCDVGQLSLASPPPVRLQNLNLIKRVNQVEFVREHLGNPTKKISIYIEKGPNEVLQFREDSITVSEPVLKQVGRFEKVLLQYWLGSSDFMTAEVAAQVLWSIFTGEHEKTRGPWLQSFATLSGYCQRQLYTLQHAEFCDLQNQMRDTLIEAEENPQPLLWSLHRVVSDVLIDGFNKLSLKEKRKFLRNIAFMNRFDDVTFGLEQALNAGDLTAMDDQLESIIRYAIAPIDISPRAFTNAFLQRRSTDRSEAFDYVLVAPEVGADLNATTLMADRNVVVESGAQKFLYPSDVGLNVSRSRIFEDFNVKTVTYVGCELPRPRRLLEFEGYAEKILFVKVCDDVGQVKDLLATGTHELLKADKDLEFVEFNLAALKLATKRRGDLQSANQIRNWSQWLQWQDYVYDDSREAFRPRAVYDAVTFFRDSETN